MRLLQKKFQETSGGITFSTDDKFIFFIQNLMKIIEQEKFIDMKLEILMIKIN